jgi:hypothetical protein
MITTKKNFPQKRSANFNVPLDQLSFLFLYFITWNTGMLNTDNENYEARPQTNQRNAHGVVRSVHA